MAVEPLHIKDFVSKEIKGPQLLSSVPFPLLSLHRILIWEKQIILSVKPQKPSVKKGKTILDLTFPYINATGLKQFELLFF